MVLWAPDAMLRAGIVCVGVAFGSSDHQAEPSSDPDPAGPCRGVGWLCLILQACKAKLLWLPDSVL